MATIVETPKFRGNYVNIFIAKKFNKEDSDDKKRYSIQAIFDKKTDISALKKAEQEAIAEKWPDAKRRPTNLDSPFMQTDTSDKVKNVDGKDIYREGYPEGSIYINLKSKDKPLVVGPDGKQITDELECYSGAYYRAKIKASAYSNIKKGVSFWLLAVQKMADGDPIQGGASLADMSFSAVDVQDTDAAFR